MDYKKEIKNIGLFERVCEASADHALDAELNLPDYCPAIQRIIKCSIIPNVISSRIQSGKITAEINAVIRLVYADESGNIASFEQSDSFEKSVEHSSISQDCISDIRIKTDYVNCRATSPRKADIRSMIRIICSVSKKRSEDILVDVNGCGIQTMKDSVQAASVTALNQKIFSVSEIKEISDDKPVVVSILNSQANAVCSEIKVINNKALIKGECNVKVYYIYNEKGDVECAEHNMPISQIIEAEGLAEDNNVNVSLSVYFCEVYSKVNSNGEMRQLDINVGIGSYLVSFEENPVSFITDAYSTSYDLVNTTKSIEVMSFNKKIDNSFTNKTVLESIGVSVERIICSSCSDMSYTYALKDSNCQISGSYEITVLYVDSEKQIGIIKKPITFDYSVALNMPAESIRCLGGVSLIGCSCAATGESRLEIKAEMFASFCVFNCRIKKYISAIETGEISSNKNDKSSLTIYFADKGEAVWNIARKYCTTVEAITEENELNERILDSSRMLLIPLAE